MEMILSFFRAILGGRDKQLIEERLKICRGCEWYKKKPDGGEYCKGCKCPASRGWPIAELNHKLGYKALRCPKGLWGEQEAISLTQIIPSPPQVDDRPKMVVPPADRIPPEVVKNSMIKWTDIDADGEVVKTQDQMDEDMQKVLKGFAKKRQNNKEALNMGE